MHGLRGDFDDGDALLDEAANLAGTSRVAAAPDRPRAWTTPPRSSGDPESGRPLFESAYAHALADRALLPRRRRRAHGRARRRRRHGFVDWTRRGIELAELDEGAAYWAGPLLNNLGWEYYDIGEFEPALDAFERALVA